jgi:hypothetical protein
VQESGVVLGRDSRDESVPQGRLKITQDAILGYFCLQDGLFAIQYTDVTMARASHASSKNRSPSPGVTAVVALCLAAGWVWLVAGTHLHEMVIGAVVVVLATLYLNVVRESSQNKIRLEWNDVAQCWRLPWYMVCDTWVVTLVFFGDLLHLRPAGSYYRVCRFKCSQRDPAVLGRGVLATIYMTATPNTIVVGIDPELSRMLFHQIERSSVPEMTQALGGQA